jgi:hypothetical protein
MPKCAYCNSTLLFGGKKVDDMTFCNAKCLSQGQLLIVARNIPNDLVSTQARNIHSGTCPVCHEQRGQVDVHTSHKIMSFVLMTSWSSNPRISCRSCGVKSQLGATVYSLLLGWWGIPWGLLITPVQIFKNIFAMLRNVESVTPSPQLEQMVRLAIASQALSDNQRAAR